MANRIFWGKNFPYTLGLNPDAPVDEIKKAFRERANKLHPKGTLSKSTSKASKSILSDATDRGTKAFSKMIGSKRLIAIAGVIVGLGTAAHIVNTASNKSREEHQKKEQERRNKQQAIKDRKYKYAGMFVDPAPMLPIQLWGERSGHHKMGNAKYK